MARDYYYYIAEQMVDIEDSHLVGVSHPAEIIWAELWFVVVCLIVGRGYYI